jgi:hypothetical protein
MANIGTTSRPAYVYDQETDTWVPVGVGPHTHENFVQSTIIDAKGDLLAGSAPDTVGRLPIGANGTMLVADATQTLGMAWANNITVNSSTDAFRITQTGSGNAFVVEDSASTDSTAFVIDTNGNVGIGLTVPGQRLDISADGPAHLQQTRYSTNATPALHYFRKARGTAASPSIVSDGDIVGGLYFNPYDGVGFVEGAQLLSVVDGTPGTNDMPTRLSFFTSPDGSATTTERMRISSGGNVNIGPLPGTGTGPLSINTNSSNSTVRMVSLLNSRTYVGVDTGGVMIAGLANNGTVGTHDYGALVFSARNGFADGGAGTVSLFSGGGSSSRTNTYKFIESNSGSAGVFDLSFWTLGAERARIDQFGSLQLGQILENITPSTTALTGVNGHWVSVFKGVAFYTNAATGNWTFDILYNGTTTLNSVMGINQSMTLTMLVQQGVTPRFTSGLNIDGVAQTVRWQGGATPASGNASSIDVYTFTIIKTASATYTVLGSQTRFA